MANEKELLIRVAYLELLVALTQQEISTLNGLVAAIIRTLPATQSEDMQLLLKRAQATFFELGQSKDSACAQNVEAARERLRSLGVNV